MIWHILALAADNPILLATPAQTAWRMLALFGGGSFYAAVGRSLLRIAMGFFAGMAAALLLASGSRRFSLIEEFLSPLMALAKAVPVASFVVVLLIWWGAEALSAVICFLVVLPNIYINILEGLKSTDSKMLEMARVFRLPARSLFFYIYRPALKPFLYSGMKISLGMCWKSGIAAEVIGVPGGSIGEGLYLSKVYLDTAGVLGWTAAVILLSVFFEKAVLHLVDRFFAWNPGCGGKRYAEQKHAKERMHGAGCPKPPVQEGAIRLTEVTKAYGGQTVIDRLSAVYEPGQIYYLTGPSGSGKTTLLRILAQLTEPDSGQMTAPSRCGVVFQEDRLCEDYSAVTNVELATGDRAGAEEALGLLLPQEALHKPCRQLSGGMRRRVALVRAMEAESRYVLLDEPFTGMDRDTCAGAMQYIRERQAGRTVIIAHHFQNFNKI